MKKSTLMFVIGALITFFGYRYFIKGKPGTAVAAALKDTAPVAEPKGSMILPQNQTEPLSSSNNTQTVLTHEVGTPVVCGYNGPTINVGTSLPLRPGDNVTAILRMDGRYDILKIMGNNEYAPNTTAVNDYDLILP